MKNSFMRKLLIYFLFFININVYSQLVTGQFLIGGFQEESSLSTIQLSNGDYFFCGTTQSFGSGGQDLLLIRFNPDFSIQWQKTIGSTNNDFFNSLVEPIENNDGSFTVLANTKSFGMGMTDILLLKISSTGNVLLSKVFGGTKEERGVTIRSALDGGYILGGSTDSYNTATSTVIERDLFLVKIDSIGNVIWSKTWGTTDNDDAASSNISSQISNILALPDSSFIVCGILESIGSYKANSFITRINSNGTILWFKKYTSSITAGHEVINDIFLQNDSTAFATGLTKSGSIGTSGGGLMFNFNINTGDINWSKVYLSTSASYNWIYRGLKDNNNRYLFNLYENGTGFGDFDVATFVTDSNGIVLQKKVFGTSNFERSIVFSKTSDNGYLFLATSGTGVNKDTYLIKTDSSFISSCNETNITITSANITINPQNYNPTVVTTINSSTISLTSNPVTVNIDTLCIDVIPSCNISSFFTSALTCLGDTTYFTDLSIDSISNIIDWSWNFGDGTTLTGAQNPSHLYTNSGNFNVTLIITNNNNCMDSITIPTTIHSTTTSTQNQSICQGDSILLGGSFQTTAGIYSDNYVSFNGCDSIVTTNLLVDSLIQLTISEDTTITPCNNVQLSVSGSNLYTWSPSIGLSCITCSNPIANPSETTTYTVQTSNNTCVVNDSITVFVKGDAMIFVPNVFTPNRDGQNDGFNINGNCIESIHKIIYNRWGMVVFESTQIDEVWDGTTITGADVPEGTFFYIFTVTQSTQTQKVFKGSLTLLR